MNKIYNTKLFSKLSWTLIGNLFFAFSQFAILSIIAKFIGPEAVGYFSLLLALASPIFIFFNFKLRSVLLTESSIQEYNTFVMLRKISLVIAGGFSIIITSVLYSNLNYILGMLFLILAKIFEMDSDLKYGLFQYKGMHSLVGKSMVIRGSLNIVGIILVILLELNNQYLFMGYLLSNFLTWYFFDSSKQKKLLNRRQNIYDIKKLKKLLYLVIPLGVSTVIGSLSTSLPRVIIEKHIGLYEMGIFSGIMYLLVVGNILLSSISTIVTPNLSKLYQQQLYKLYFKNLSFIVLLGFFISVLINISIFIWGENILRIVFTVEYTGYTKLFERVGIGLIFLYSSIFLGTGLNAMRKFKYHPYINGIALLGMFIYIWINKEALTLLTIANAILANYIILSFLYVFGIHIAHYLNLRSNNEK